MYKFSGKLKALSLCIALLALAVLQADPAAAQFEIKSPKVEKGELEVENHSSFQSGLPKEEGEAEDATVAKAGDDEEEEEDEKQIRHGHEISVGYGFTDFWKAELGFTVQKPEGYNLEATALEFENTLELTTFASGHATLGFFAAISLGLESDEPDALEFGPLVEFGNDERSLILNAIFEKTFGENREEGLGLEYATQVKFAAWGKISLGAEAFGEIENIDDVPSFDETELRVGPVIFFSSESGDEKAENGKGNDDDDEDKGLKRGEEEPEVSAAVGVLFGATDATPDWTLKWDVEIGF